ncbi:MAG: hypothetical protein LBU24_04735 [Methanocalculaceae archaeon]|nr:hypothetical protein [Methanocalculaceae archaeon]
MSLYPQTAPGSRIGSIELLTAGFCPLCHEGSMSGNRNNRCSLPWERLDRNDTATELVLATNSYVASGAEGYGMFARKHPSEGSMVDAAVFADYLTVLTKEGGGSFTYSEPEKRIQTPGNIPLDVPVYRTNISPAEEMFGEDQFSPMQQVIALYSNKRVP